MASHDSYAIAKVEQSGLPRQVSAKLRKVQYPLRNVANWRFTLGDSARIHELQLQHVRTSSLKTIYFNGKQVHRSSSQTRDWVWTAQLYEYAHPVKIVIDYSTYQRRGEDTVGYDLYIDGIPFGRMQRHRPAVDAMPTARPVRGHAPTQGQQRWGASGSQHTTGAANNHSPAPASAPAPAPVSAPAPAPAAAPDLLSFDGAGDADVRGPAAASSTFDPLCSTDTVESISDDLAGLSWNGMGGPDPRQEAAAGNGGGNGSDSGGTAAWCDLPDEDGDGEVEGDSGFSFLGGQGIGSSSADEGNGNADVPVDAWEAGTVGGLVDLDAKSPSSAAAAAA
eukprot:g1523.t1